MIKIRKLILKALLLGAFLTNIVLAQETSNASSSKDSTKQPIDVIADSGSYDQLKQIAIYQGNVEVTQGVSTIFADKITVHFKNNEAEEIIAIGKPLKFVFKGDKLPIYGEGNNAKYIILSKTITLKGNAVITQGEDIIKGDTLTYDLLKEKIKGKRLRMTIQPAGK